MFPIAPWWNCHPESSRRAFAFVSISGEADPKTTARTGPGRSALAAEHVAVSRNCRRDELNKAASFANKANCVTKNALAGPYRRIALLFNMGALWTSTPNGLIFSRAMRP
jgi:hypothetical protein